MHFEAMETLCRRVKMFYPRLRFVVFSAVLEELVGVAAVEAEDKHRRRLGVSFDNWQFEGHTAF